MMLSSQNKRKRKILTLKTKVYIIKKFENGEKISQISKNLKLPYSTVSSIIKDRNRILAASKNEFILNTSTIIRKRHGIIAQMEHTLKEWCDQQSEHNVRLTKSDICEQAKVIFEELKRDYGEAAKGKTFLASKGWYCRFKLRRAGNCITTLEDEDNIDEENETEAVEVKKEGQKEKGLTFYNVEMAAESSFSDVLKAVIKEAGYTPQTVFNVDEIGVYWKKLPENNHIAHQDQHVGVFNESKDRLTVLLGGNAAGDLKLKPLVIYRTENPKALHNKAKGGLPVIWKSNSRASMSASLFEEWFGYYFIPEVEQYCFAHNIPCKVLLVIDSASYHPPVTLTDFDHRVHVVFLPPGETSSIQPVSQEIATIFKALYTRRVFGHLVELIRQNDTVTVDELWKDFNILNAIRIMVDSWNDITKADWRKSWLKLCPFFTIDSETVSDFFTVSDIIREIVNLASVLDMKVNDKDVSDLLDSHNKEPTIEELLEMQEYSNNEEFETQDPLLDGGAMTVENLTEAFSHIKLGLQILENIDVNEQRARTTKLGVTKLLSAYEEILNEKIKLMAYQDDSVDMATTSN